MKKAKKIHQSVIKRLEKGDIHGRGWGDIKWNTEIIKQKDIVINALEGKGNYYEAKNLINKWKGSHIKVKEWLKVADKESIKNYRGGNIKWQDKWIKNYEQSLKELDKIYLKK